MNNNDPIWISNLPKLIIAGLTIVCMTILLAFGSIKEEAGLPIISATGVYILTNGVRASRERREDTVIVYEKEDDGK